MISIPWSIFNTEADEGQEMSKNRFNDTQSKQRSASSSTSVDVGLRILLIQLSQGKSNVVFKPTFLLKIKPTFRSNRIDPHASYYSESTFLKSCHLCNKTLSLDKDIYMYRGDQGFCSVECRNRQIYLDEMKEIEESTKKMLATFRQCGPSSSDHRCETRALLEQFRQRHKP